MYSNFENKVDIYFVILISRAIILIIHTLQIFYLQKILLDPVESNESVYDIQWKVIDLTTILRKHERNCFHSPGGSS